LARDVDSFDEEINMTERQQVWIAEYQLTLFEKDRLVKVARASSPLQKDDRTTMLPAWTFQSKSTIWLTDENVPIQIRASRGEQIKKKILAGLL
jgi:hypothetical protein